MKILLVEDNEMNSDMLIRRLRRRGHEMHLARDGAAGVAMAKELLPELILMDIGLPVMDGLEATRQIKADTRTAKIPIVALTAHAMAGDEARCWEAGVDAYDTKPIDIERLLRKMDEARRKLDENNAG